MSVSQLNSQCQQTCVRMSAIISVNFSPSVNVNVSFRFCTGVSQSQCDACVYYCESVWASGKCQRGHCECQYCKGAICPACSLLLMLTQILPL